MMRAAVVGVGYWGPNIVRNFLDSGVIDVALVCDSSPEQLARIHAAHPGLATTPRFADVLADDGIDAVAIATPVASHFSLAMAALRAGKHLWIEKPITASVAEAERLCEEADRRGKILFVDHTFLYTGAVRKLRELIGADELGKLSCYGSVRANLGLYRPDVDVLWDLAVHDVAILEYAVGASVVAVSAVGVANVPGLPVSAAFMTAQLEGGALLHVHASWFSPTRVRTTTITGDRSMIVYDDNEPVEKVRVWDRGVDVVASPDGRPVVGYRRGAAAAPALETHEALLLAARHFAESVATGTRPITDGRLGLRVVRVMEAAARSMRDQGRPVELGGSHA
jgi:predicted dehydrogenase